MRIEECKMAYYATGDPEKFIESIFDTKLTSIIHQLAEEKDKQLLENLYKLYKSRNLNVKMGVLELLGFHYELSHDISFIDSLVEIIRDNTMNDDLGSSVRETAASVLGNQIEFVKPEYIKLLDTINSNSVKIVLLHNLLRVSGLSLERVEKLTELLNKDGKTITSRLYYILST